MGFGNLGVDGLLVLGLSIVTSFNGLIEWDVGGALFEKVLINGINRLSKYLVIFKLDIV